MYSLFATTNIQVLTLQPRYIDWVITTPLLLTDLLLTAGMPWPSILFVILIDEIMIVTGLAGALVRTSYKWGYFTFGCVALFYILYMLGWEARKHANALGRDIEEETRTVADLRRRGIMVKVLGHGGRHLYDAGR